MTSIQTSPPEPVLTTHPIDYRELQSEQIVALLTQANEVVVAGRTLAEDRHLGDPELQARFAAARALADAGDFARAFSTAFELFLLQPGNRRFAYLSGLCLQRLDQPGHALAFFASAGVGGQFPPALFSMAECYAALGHDKEAMQCFDEAVAQAKGKPRYQEMAEAANEAAYQIHQKLKREQTGGQPAGHALAA